MTSAVEQASPKLSRRLLGRLSGRGGGRDVATLEVGGGSRRGGGDAATATLSSLAPPPAATPRPRQKRVRPAPRAPRPAPPRPTVPSAPAHPARRAPPARRAARSPRRAARRCRTGRASSVSSGEAVACLSLAGNHAVKLVADDVGGAVEYSVRTMQAGELTPVAGPFVYACDGVFGGEKGKAVVFRPHHDPSLVIVAFRGVRTQVAPADDVEPRYSTPGDGGASDGGGSSTNSSFTKAAPRSRPPSPRTAGQKPPLGASAGAAAADEKGDALAEQAAIDRANFVRVECAEPGWLSGSALRVHAGVLDHHESLWDSRPGSRGLVDWVADQISREPAQRVVFVGLSFGGALAQLTAYRVARVYPSLRDSLHVLAMGSVQWANALMARHARNVFGDRVVNLVTTRVVSLAATPEAARAALLRRAELPGWWVPLDASAAHCLVVDPVTANASREFQPLANVFALSMPAGAGAHETDLPLALLPAPCVQPVMDVSVPRATLVDWISGRSPPTSNSTSTTSASTSAASTAPPSSRSCDSSAAHGTRPCTTTSRCTRCRPSRESPSRRRAPAARRGGGGSRRSPPMQWRRRASRRARRPTRVGE